MNAKIVGFQELDYVNKTGKPVKGIVVNSIYEEHGTIGYSVSKDFVSVQNSKLYDIVYNLMTDGCRDMLDVKMEFDRRGILCDINY